jgi:hypothetical protein
MQIHHSQPNIEPNIRLAVLSGRPRQSSLFETERAAVPSCFTPSYRDFFTISAKLSAFNDAPPTSEPSTFGFAINDATLSGFTLPPY